MSFSVLGAINPGDPFLIVLPNAASLPVVLQSFTSSGGGIGYYGFLFDDCARALPTSVPVFRAAGSWEKVLITDTTNSVNLDYTSNNILGSSILGQDLTLSSSFSLWDSPALFLSGGPYTLQNGSGQTLNIRVGNGTGNPETYPTVPAEGVFFVPVVWFYGCSSTTQRTVNTVPQTLTSYCCTIFGDPICTSQVPTEGWTSTSDCAAGVRYNYCTGGTPCGNTNCKAGCPSSDDDCTYNSSSGLFVCTFDINNLFRGKWYLQPWFLILVGTIVVGLIILIVVYFLSRRKA